MPDGYDIRALAAGVLDTVGRYPDERERVEAIKPLLARWMERQEGLLPQHRLPCEGRACGHLLHSAADGSFFIISVVFPPGTSSGVHYHGAWGVIGVLSGVPPRMWSETPFSSPTARTRW